MMLRPSRAATVVGASMLALWGSTSAHGLTVTQLNLAEQARYAGKILRGTVAAITPGSARLGGHELPAVTYRIRVDESFKGTVQTAKDVRYADVRMLAALMPRRLLGPAIAVRELELPVLQRGEEYLLFVTEPSTAGLCSTVGLGQGRYRIRRLGRSEEAVNDFDNQHLFRGMDPQGLPTRGPIPYGELARRIRAIVASTGR